MEGKGFKASDRNSRTDTEGKGHAWEEENLYGNGNGSVLIWKSGETVHNETIGATSQVFWVERALKRGI